MHGHMNVKLVTADFVFESDRKHSPVLTQCFLSSLVPCSQWRLYLASNLVFAVQVHTLVELL
jgi:hypothetical protein